ncbi:hypothetical protein C8F04DRAFT_1111186 [Mycena alexandri]|uniref:Uncharacterized protein n=1 Tax=Mycena alexandri TaxID=1745969 RepID=A0AAD6SS23_9AGAR|nr:hypothetical protein C8F04DRAFT_1111186 [Mycena alexandri]
MAFLGNNSERWQQQTYPIIFRIRDDVGGVERGGLGNETLLVTNLAGKHGMFIRTTRTPLLGFDGTVCQGPIGWDRIGHGPFSKFRENGICAWIAAGGDVNEIILTARQENQVGVRGDNDLPVPACNFRGFPGYVRRANENAGFVQSDNLRSHYEEMRES